MVSVNTKGLWVLELNGQVPWSRTREMCDQNYNVCALPMNQRHHSLEQWGHWTESGAVPSLAFLLGLLQPKAAETSLKDFRSPA